MLYRFDIIQLAKNNKLDRNATHSLYEKKKKTRIQQTYLVINENGGTHVVRLLFYVEKRKNITKIDSFYFIFYKIL